MDISHIQGRTYRLSPRFLDLGLYRLNETECILLDTGFHRTAKNELVPFFQQQEWVPRGILCTHSHVDHAGGNSLLRETFGSVLAVPYAEHVLCENGYNMVVLSDNLRFRVFGKTIPDFHYRTDHVVNPEASSVTVAGITFQVIKLFGHSPYQLGYVTPDRVAYLGDALLSEKTMKRTKLPYIFDVGQDLETKRRLKTVEADWFLLSHEGVFDEIDHLVDLNITYIHEKLALLRRLLSEPLTFDAYTAKVVEALGIRQDLRKIVYINRAVRGYLSYFQETNQVEAFLDENQIKFVRR